MKRGDRTEKIKLTKLEIDWILYDVGNSAFILLTATILPIYFNHLAMGAGLKDVNALAYWGYAASAATLIVAAIGPVLGALADTKGYKKPIFTVALLAGAVGCALLSRMNTWASFLIFFLIAKVGYSCSLIFYDSMLPDISPPNRMDMVSSQGYAWGYLGSCIPFLLSLVFVLFYERLDITFEAAVSASLCLNALWWLLSSAPLLRNYRQIHFVQPRQHVVRESFGRLAHAFQELKSHKNIFFFLVAFFFYIDGVYTIIEMATAYGSALGLDSASLLLALLVTQIVAFPFAILFGMASKRYPSDCLIRLCILAYMGIALFAVQLNQLWEFWVLAICVGMFQGAIQALSRSYFAKIIPPEKSGEYFGIFDICGKGASFMGTALMGLFAQITGSPNGGVAILAVMFLIGYCFFKKAIEINVEGSGSGGD